MLQRGKETNGVHSLIPARKICEDKRKMLACLIVSFVQIEHQKSDSKQLKLKRIELLLFKLESKKKKEKKTNKVVRIWQRYCLATEHYHAGSPAGLPDTIMLVYFYFLPCQQQYPRQSPLSTSKKRAPGSKLTCYFCLHCLRSPPI